MTAQQAPVESWAHAEAERLYARNPNFWGHKAGFIEGAEAALSRLQDEDVRSRAAEAFDESFSDDIGFRINEATLKTAMLAALSAAVAAITAGGDR